MKRITHNLIQGTPEWHEFRAKHYGSSEAAAMLGMSKYKTREALMREKATGIGEDHSERTQSIFANGHRVEALARPLVEEMIYEELYPVVMSYGKLSASCDGLTADGEIYFEHKQWNEELAASMRAGILPKEHIPQVQQGLLVTGAKTCMFVCSDGTRERFAIMDIGPNQDSWATLNRGWDQFEKDLAEYKPQEVIPAVVAAPAMALPTVSIQVSGAVALTSNLDAFQVKLKEFITRIPAKPSTDQEFADCKAAVKALKDAEDALDAAEKQALGQVASFDDMRRAKQLCFDLSRQTRLALEKLVVARESQIKAEIIASGRLAIAAHIEALDKLLGGRYMPPINDRFAEVIKSKRTVDSLRNAVDTELARLKIEADAISRTIQANLNTLEMDAIRHGYESLFPDFKAICTKAPDDFTALVALRISQHKAAQEAKAKADAERAAKEAADIAAKTAQPIIEPAAQQVSTAILRAMPSQEDIVQRETAVAVARPSRLQMVVAVADQFGVHQSVAELWLIEEFGVE